MNLKDFKNFMESCYLLGVAPSWEALRTYKKNLKKLQHEQEQQQTAIELFKVA